MFEKNENKQKRGRGWLIFYINDSTLAYFLVFNNISQINLQVGYSGKQTRIVEVEGMHADHMNTTYN